MPNIPRLKSLMTWSIWTMALKIKKTRFANPCRSLVYSRPTFPTDPLMTDRAPWIFVSERLPAVDQDVWYFFEVTGISPGKFYGEEDGLLTFGGDRGFLGGDVTHWMPRAEGDMKPEPPPGYSRAERFLVSAARMPFDSPETWRLGNKDAPASAPEDWAHAAARGAFEALFNEQDFRMAMRATPEDRRGLLVSRVADVIRQAKKESEPGYIHGPNEDYAGYVEKR